MSVFSKDSVKVVTSLTHKGSIAPKGHVYYIAKLIDKDKNMVYTLHQLAVRRGADEEQETTFIEMMKERLLSDYRKKMQA